MQRLLYNVFPLSVTIETQPEFVCQCITQFLWAILAAAMRVCHFCITKWYWLTLAATTRVCLSMYQLKSGCTIRIDACVSVYNTMVLVIPAAAM